MEPPKRSSAYRIEDPAQAAVFDHPHRRQLLLACGREDRSLAQLGSELGQSLSKLHYHAGRLVDCGLLRVARTEPRAGRPVRFYRAVAEAFLISQDLIRSPSDDLARELRAALADVAHRQELSVMYALDAQGRMRVRLTPTSPGPTSARLREYWILTRLTAEQRASLAQEIEALIARYQPSPGHGAGDPYILHAAFAPRRAG